MTTFWRVVFFLALFGNLLFVLWSNGHFGRLEDGREPQRVSHQLDPDKLRVTEVPPAPPPTTEVCRLIGGLTLAEAQRLHDKAQAEAGTGAAARLIVKPLEQPPGHWVHIPPLANRALADKKLLELRQRGIADAELVLAEGTDRFAISLGMFSSAEEAATHLEALTKRGVRTAIVQARSRPAEKAQVEAHGPREPLLKQLPELLGSLGLPNTSIEDCPNEKQP